MNLKHTKEVQVTELAIERGVAKMMNRWPYDPLLHSRIDKVLHDVLADRAVQYYAHVTD